MTMIPEIRQTLTTAAEEQLPAAKSGLAHATDQLRTAAQQFMAITEGSTQPEVERARELMSAALTGLEAEQETIGSAIGRIATYNAENI